MLDINSLDMLGVFSEQGHNQVNKASAIAAMIQEISFDQLLPIWRTKLWPNRQSEITPNSAMVFLGGYDGSNMHTEPTFWGYITHDTIAGVNSGHMCADGSYRSRGLWVDPGYRNQGIGRKLLLATVQRAQANGASFCWSLPRHQSWPVYQSAGFSLSSDWFPTETSDLNAFCQIDF